MPNANAQHLYVNNNDVTSQRDVINKTTVMQYWPYNLLIFLVFKCHYVLIEKNRPGIYWTTLAYMTVGGTAFVKRRRCFM